VTKPEVGLEPTHSALQERCSTTELLRQLIHGIAVRFVAYRVNMANKQPRDHPKDVGDKTTLAVMLALRMAGLKVLVPFGENTRYDLVVDEGMRFARIQCKTGRLRRGAIQFNVCSTYGHHQRPGNVRRGYDGEIDYFAVFCPDNDGVYLVPFGELQVRTQAALRVEPSRNRQTRNVRLAGDYEVGRVAIRPTARPGAIPGALGSSA
jgi:PD-(D/E)XK endonuclease